MAAAFRDLNEERLLGYSGGLSGRLYVSCGGPPKQSGNPERNKDTADAQNLPLLHSRRQSFSECVQKFITKSSKVSGIDE